MSCLSKESSYTVLSPQLLNIKSFERLRAGVLNCSLFSWNESFFFCVLPQDVGFYYQLKHLRKFLNYSSSCLECCCAMTWAVECAHLDSNVICLTGNIMQCFAYAHSKSVRQREKDYVGVKALRFIDKFKPVLVTSVWCLLISFFRSLSFCLFSSLSSSSVLFFPRTYLGIRD